MDKYDEMAMEFIERKVIPTYYPSAGIERSLLENTAGYLAEAFRWYDAQREKVPVDDSLTAAYMLGVAEEKERRDKETCKTCLHWKRCPKNKFIGVCESPNATQLAGMDILPHEDFCCNYYRRIVEKEDSCTTP